MALKFERYSRKPPLRRRQFYFRIVDARNGEIICPSEGYNNRLDRDDAITLLKGGVATAPVKDVAR